MEEHEQDQAKSRDGFEPDLECPNSSLEKLQNSRIEVPNHSMLLAKKQQTPLRNQADGPFSYPRKRLFHEQSNVVPAGSTLRSTDTEAKRESGCAKKREKRQQRLNSFALEQRPPALTELNWPRKSSFQRHFKEDLGPEQYKTDSQEFAMETNSLSKSFFSSSDSVQS